jgi:hypothetical protein
MSDLIESRISEIRPFSDADRIAQLEARIYQLNRFVSSARQSFNKKDPSILGEAIATLNDQNRCIAAGSPEGVRLIQSAAPLDPSSAPSETPKGTFFDLLDEYAEAHRRGQRLRCISLGAKILVAARSPDREAGSGTPSKCQRCDCGECQPVPSEGGGE